MVLLAGILTANNNLVFNFNSKESLANWMTINDGVMGGISESSFIFNENGTATFSGVLSQENNGGFASARALLTSEVLKDFKYAVIRINGDGKTYSLRFKTTETFDGISYRTKFVTEKDKWSEYKLLLKDFKPVFRGRVISNRPALKSKDIKQVGFLVSDEQYGEFSLDIDWIKFN